MKYGDKFTIAVSRLIPGYLSLILCLFLINKTEAQQFPFYDDFENGLLNWETSTWDTTLVTYSSKNISLTDSPDENYSGYADSEILLKNTIDISASTRPVLCFWQKYITQGNVDFCWVDVSTDGGLGWTNIAKFSGGHYTWNHLSLDLTEYKSSLFKIKFRLTSNSSTQYDGWYIDDVEIKEQVTDVNPFPFKDNFENGLDNWLYSDLGWDTTSATCSSTKYAITDSPEGNYPAYAESHILLKNNIDLTATEHPVLSFWNKYITQGTVDVCWVDISQDGGLNWENLTTYWAGHYDWQYELYDLTPYKSSSLFKVRFRLTSNSSTQYDGWYIDDVEIKEFNTSLYSFPFSDDFENGLDNWLYSDTGWDTTHSWFKSDSHSITDSPGRNYNNYSDSHILLKNSIDLTASQQPVISFWHQYLTQGGTDQCMLEMSTDGGFSWQTDTFFSGGATEGKKELFDISDYISPLFKVRFRFTSNSSTTYDGWYIDDVEIRNLVSALEPEASKLKTFELYQNYPNPFNPKTTIEYQLPELSQVNLSIYNLLGQKVATLVSTKQTAGSYKAEWDASVFASGLYIYRLETNFGFVQNRKLLLLK